MTRHIDEEFEGVISGITSWGIYVELPNTVEGMVHISKLAGEYYYSEDKYEMIGKDNSYKLGQKVKIKVDFVDMSSKTIDFSMV